MEVIEISDSDEEPRAKRQKTERDSPFFTVDSPFTAGTSIASLVEGVATTYQFTLLVDPDYFLPEVSVETRVHLVSAQTVDVSAYTSAGYNVSQHVVRNLGHFGSHHLKIMVNFKAHAMEVVVLTCNLLPVDQYATQCGWRSGWLPQTTAAPPNRFQASLVEYLQQYQLPAVSRLARLVQGYDFGSVTAEFLWSAPGHRTDAVCGYPQLGRVLRELGLVQTETSPAARAFAQMSSLAAPVTASKVSTKLMFHHILLPTMCGVDLLPPNTEPVTALCSSHHLTPVVVYPLKRDVLALRSPYCGALLFYLSELARAKQQHEMLMTNHWLYRWMLDGPPGHCKFYGVTNKWTLMTSANLSKAAWGFPLKNGFQVNSYEAGVLVHGGDNVRVRLPFALNTKYSASDVPWEG